MAFVFPCVNSIGIVQSSVDRRWYLLGFSPLDITQAPEKKHSNFLGFRSHFHASGRPGVFQKNTPGIRLPNLVLLYSRLVPVIGSIVTAQSSSTFYVVDRLRVEAFISPTGEDKWMTDAGPPSSDCRALLVRALKGKFIILVCPHPFEDRRLRVERLALAQSG